MILHIDMDAFFASIEQAINPRLKGRPLIVGSRGKRLHTVVCAASYEAKALGIESGMPSAEAFRLCPNLEFVPAEQGKYIWTSEQILELLRGYGFSLEYVSIDEFQLDIADCPDPAGLAQDIQQRILQAFNISASVGIAKNCLLAKLASKINKPNGIAVLTPDNLELILARTPVEKLCGVGQKTSQVLHNAGVKTCLELYRKSASFFEGFFGKSGLNLYLSLHSTDSFEEPDQDQKPRTVGHSYTLPQASENPVFIKAWVRLLSEMVAQRLRKQNLTSRTTHLWLDTPEMAGLSAQKTHQIATNDGAEIYRRSLKILARTAQKRPKIRAIGVTCSSLSEECYPPLFNEQKRREGLLKAMDKINARFGDYSVYPAIILRAKAPANK